MSKLDQHIALSRKVKDQAHGQWDRILTALAPETIPAIAKAGRSHVDCPFPKHGGKRDFRVDKSFEAEGLTHCTCGHRDGFSVIQELRGWDFTKTVAEIDALLGGRGLVSLPEPIRPMAVTRAKDASRSSQHMEVRRMVKKWWGESVSLTHPSASPVRAYFRKRKLGQVLLPLNDLAYHPALPYFDPEKGHLGDFPAMLALIRTAGGTHSTVHRTWLTEDGDKAPVPVARKQYTSPEGSPCTGGAIRLDHADGPVLNLAEGIETALAARAITELPTWSCVNKELLKQVVIPESVKIVTIWADLDRSMGGQEAAIALMDRLRSEGRVAVVFLPPVKMPEKGKGVDWNDVLAHIGLEHTRDLLQVRHWRQGLNKALANLDKGLTIDKLRLAQ